MQNRTEKEIMPLKTAVNLLFNDIWHYLVIGCFGWKIGVFQQTAVKVYCILKMGNPSKGHQKDCFYWFFLVLRKRRAYVEILPHNYSATASHKYTLCWIICIKLIYCIVVLAFLIQKISELLPYRSLVQLYVFHKNYEEQNSKRSA